MATADSFEQVVTQAADKLLKAIEAYGPQATQLILETGRIAAMQTLVTGAVLFAIGAALAFASVILIRLDDDDSFSISMASVVVPMCAIGCLIVGSISLCSVYAWVGLTRPEVYLAAKLLKL